MSTVRASKTTISEESTAPDSKTAVIEQAANELIFAVVGYAGSGTSTIAEALSSRLSSPALLGGGYEVEIIKSREIISAWALAQSPPEELPKATGNLDAVERFQDLGDQMRKADHAAIAKGLIGEIRKIRAKKTGVSEPGQDPVRPDGKKRAYILDSIRHPAEIELLRHIYQDAFLLIGVVCEESQRLSRVSKKYENAGQTKALKFMKRDAKAGDKHGQRVSDAFHLSDFFLDNTADRYAAERDESEEWEIIAKLDRLIRIITHNGIIRPEISETAMYHAYAASMQSACLSRQVGAALVDASGSVIATGTNEVPRAGGGVYGESFDEHSNHDHRCAYKRTGTGPHCSNTSQQNEIIDELIGTIPELAALDGMRKLKLKFELRKGRVGELIEFSRAVHAEMDAVLSAGRARASTVGTRLFVTAFPCHYCARHIVTAGIDEVQFIEPYPKSKALGLHPDAIASDPRNWTPPSAGGKKVLFRPFVGVSPRLYRRAFLKDRELKNSASGVLEIQAPEWGTPWHLRSASYAELEATLAKLGS